MARKHASDVHLGAFGSQNHDGTDHRVKLAAKTDAYYQSSDAGNTIDNHNAGYHPLPHRQHHCTVTCHLESAICGAFLNWFLIGAKEMG